MVVCHDFAGETKDFAGTLRYFMDEATGGEEALGAVHRGVGIDEGGAVECE